jgi:predicted dehydrogenase
MEKDHWAHGIPGGRLFEANPHNLYLLHGLVGEMELIDIQVQKVNRRWKHAPIDEFTASLRAGRTNVSLHMSLNAESRGGSRHGANFIVVVGSKQTLYAEYKRIADLGDFAIHRMGASRFDRLRQKVLEALPFRAEKNPINSGQGSGHYWMLDRFVGFLQGRYAEEAVPFDEAYYVQRMNLEMGHLAESRREDQTSSPERKSLTGGYYL